MSAEELAYRCDMLVLSFTSNALYLAAVPGPGTELIRIIWQWKASMASVGAQLATIAAGRANPPPLGIGVDGR